MSVNGCAVLKKWEKPAFSIGPITRSDIVRYGDASQDFNPLHHDETYARELGHPSVFAHGMFSAGVLASFVTLWFGGDSVQRFSAKFREIVWPGDTLTADGKIVSIRKDDEMLFVSLDLTLRRNEEHVAVEGQAEVALFDG